jgi:hypothetical protein
MAACRSSSENTRKMSLIHVFNKNLPRAHTESEFDVLGVHRKLVEYVVHSSKRKKWKKNEISSHKLPKQQSTSFWSQGILGVNTRFQQKFTTGTYGVGIWCAWCSRKACEICSSLIQKKKSILKKKSSHKLPKQQSTSFWSQWILGDQGRYQVSCKISSWDLKSVGNWRTGMHTWHLALKYLWRLGVVVWPLPAHTWASDRTPGWSRSNAADIHQTAAAASPAQPTADSRLCTRSVWPTWPSLPRHYCQIFPTRRCSIVN